MIRFFQALFLALFAAGLPHDAGAGELTALARFDPAGSSVQDAAGGVEIRLQITRPVPYRVGFLADPPRLVVDFQEVDWGTGVPSDLLQSDHVLDLRAGVLHPGWSRLIAELDGPWHVAQAAMETGALDGTARVVLRLEATDDETFAAAVSASVARAEPWADVVAAGQPAPKRRQEGDTALMVVLDPGHGGIDPGAETPEGTEAGLILTLARELKEKLLRQGFQVVMTREEDAFVPLEERVSIARAVRADVFLSLHADALLEGQATGARVYTLSEEASDAASAALAERHDRGDLLAGVDLARQDDRIAAVMMDLARTETAPRSDRLAMAVVETITAAGLPMHRKPHASAGFSVLKSPDIPSVLLEVGYLSNPKDLANLNDPDWRSTISDAIVRALMSWALADAAEAKLLRQ